MKDHRYIITQKPSLSIEKAKIFKKNKQLGFFVCIHFLIISIHFYKKALTSTLELTPILINETVSNGDDMEWTVSQTHKILLSITPESYEIIRMTVELLRDEEMGGANTEIIIKGLDDLDAGLITDAQMDDIVYDLYLKVFSF